MVEGVLVFAVHLPKAVAGKPKQGCISIHSGHLGSGLQHAHILRIRHSIKG